MESCSENSDHLLRLRGFALLSASQEAMGFYSGLSLMVAPGEALRYTMGANESNSKG